MARRTHVVTRGGKSDRQSVWIGITLLQVALVAGSKTMVLSLNAAALAARPFTIIRTRFLLQYTSDQLAASEAPQANFGIIVVSDQAVAAGAASVPGPTTNTDAPWFVHEGLIADFIFGDGTGFHTAGGYVTKVDSKAMRKVGQNEDVAFMVEQRAALGAIIALQGRMLVKLH